MLYTLSIAEIKKGGWHRARIHCSEIYKFVSKYCDNAEYIIDRAEWHCGYYDDRDDKLLELLWESAVRADVVRSARLGRDRAEFLLFAAEVRDKNRIIETKFRKSWERVVTFSEAFLEANEEALMKVKK